MINEKDKKIIDDFLKEQNFNFDEYDDFIEYIQARGMLNDDISFIDKIFFTLSNLQKLYLEYINPVKRVLRTFDLTYKELAEKIGYTENGLKNAVSKNKITLQLETALILLVKNYELQNKVKEQGETISELQRVIQTILDKK